MAENIQYQKVKEITDQLERGIQELFESERYMSWLKTMSRFHDYSLNNTLLIAFQKPDATLVAGYTSWQKQFGRQVQKGEKAIKILAPAPYKEKVEMEKIDPVTQTPVLDADGRPVKEVQEIQRPAFKVVNVFDVSQTEGRELPTLGVDELTGNVQQYELFFEALKRTSPVSMEFESIESGAKGYYHQIEQRIAIQEGMSQVQTIKTAIHEMAHQKLHAINPERKVEEPIKQSRNSKEVEAESVAYTICQHYGIETSDYSFAYIAGWSHGKETPELKASLQTIRKSASEMIKEIDAYMTEITREYATELASELYAYADEVDPYGARDTVEEVEEFIRDTSKDLMERNEKVKDILYWLKMTPVESLEQENRSYELMEKITDFTGVRLEEEPSITFYVAECSEYPELGEFYGGLSLEEAFAAYDRIPEERMHGIKGIGFELKDGSDYSGPYPMMEAGVLHEDLVNMVEHYKESPLVQDALANCRMILVEREKEKLFEMSETFRIGESHYLHIQEATDGSWDYTIYDTAFKDQDGGQIEGLSDEQVPKNGNQEMKRSSAIKEILISYGLEKEEIVAIDAEQFFQERDFAEAKERMEKGIVYEDYVLSNGIAHELRKEGIEPFDFSEEQSQVLYEAAQNGLPVSILAKPEFSVSQMELMVQLLEEGYRIEHFECNGKMIDLTEKTLSERQIENIRYHQKIGPFEKEDYSQEQWDVIQKGMKDHLDIRRFADPTMTAEQMKDHLKVLRQEKRVQKSSDSQPGREDYKDKKKSVLADLQNKKEAITQSGVAKQNGPKKRTKEMEQA